MIDRLNAPPRHSANRFGGGINRVQNPWRARSIPYITILLGSCLPFLLLADVMPLLPPIGFMIFVGWRIMRPGFLPLWAGVPLGFFDDLFSGQPLGSAVFLWSITMIVLEIIEARFPWRGFWQDWFTASFALIVYVFAAMAVSGAELTIPMVIAALPQVAMAIVLYPLGARMIAWLDLFRLTRSRRIG